MRNVFSSLQVKLFGLCLGILALGYVLLAQGPVDNPMSKTLAPLILVSVYCVLVPAVFLIKEKQPEKADQKNKGV